MHIAIDAVTANRQVRGPDRYLIRLLQALAQLDDDTRFTVFHAHWQTYLENLGLDPRFTFVRLQPPGGRVLRVLWHAVVFPALARRVQPDVLHLINPVYLWRYRGHVVTTVHDVGQYRYPEKMGWLRSMLLRHLWPYSVAQADRVIVVSDYTRRDAVRFLRYPDESMHTIWLGGPDAVAPASPTAPAVEAAGAPPYFLYVGAVERSKNVERLVAAFLGSAALRAAGAELVVVGRVGNSGPAIQQLLAQHADAARVRLRGYVTDAELPALYRGAAAFVFLSLIEGFGLVLLEAMAYGTPVIAADASVTPEVVGDAALLVDGEDTAAIGAAMERLLELPQLGATLRARGTARLALFSWQRNAEQTLVTYRAALGDPGRAGREVERRG